MNFSLLPDSILKLNILTHYVWFSLHLCSSAGNFRLKREFYLVLERGEGRDKEREGEREKP